MDLEQIIRDTNERLMQMQVDGAKRGEAIAGIASTVTELRTVVLGTANPPTPGMVAQIAAMQSDISSLKSSRAWVRGVLWVLGIGGGGSSAAMAAKTGTLPFIGH